MKRQRITKIYRLSCVFLNMWYGVCAPFQGGARGGDVWDLPVAQARYFYEHANKLHHSGGFCGDDG